uniref:Uncharacterized protein n=1 Tax=Anguilla anguilla TaxID=7936 RepID=A0A0E9RA79_ANGAN
MASCVLPMCYIQSHFHSFVFLYNTIY